MEKNKIHLTYEQFWEMVSALKMTSSIYQAYSDMDDTNFKFLGDDIQKTIEDICACVNLLEKYTMYFDPDDQHATDEFMELVLKIDAPEPLNK